MKELFGIPIIEDDRLAADEGFLLSAKRTCKCDPATIVRIVLLPRPGVECACGAVWPFADEPEVK